jgi:phage recombination protein Bet
MAKGTTVADLKKRQGGDTQVAEPQTGIRKSLVEKMAARFNVEADKLVVTLKATAFQSSKQISNEQLMMLMVVSDQYGLNPFTKEIYAFPDRSGIVPVVGVDGWIRMCNDHPAMDGIEFEMSDTLAQVNDKHKPCPAFVICRIWRKDRNRPIEVPEYLDECYRDTGPWNQSTRRMLRHKALIQCARIAFGFSGIYTPDEAVEIVEGNASPESFGTSRVDAVPFGDKADEEVTEVDTNGEMFDPELHQVDGMGNPIFNADGAFRKRRQRQAAPAQQGDTAAGESVEQEAQEQEQEEQEQEEQGAAPAEPDWNME